MNSFFPQHPFILSPVYASFNGIGLMTVRQFVPTGSLRDAIYGQQPQANLLQKYGGTSGRRVLGLTPANIAKYGRQVLEALRFLFEKGYVLGMWYMYVCCSVLQLVSHMILLYLCKNFHQLFM
jgi:hypothetical protein